jgi:hypothetical protein
MAQTTGVRSTIAAITTDNRLVRNITDEIMELEPNEKPLLTLLLQMKHKQKTETPVIEWLEQDYIARWGQNGSTTSTNDVANTTLTVVDGTVFAKGDVFMVPKAIDSNALPEMIRVTSIGATVIAVKRAFGGSTVATIGANGALRLIGSANEEGGVLPTAKYQSQVNKTTYTQIFKAVLDLTNTYIASKQYGDAGNERKRLQRQKMVEFKEQLNAALYWGQPSQDLTGGDNGRPIRSTMGINYAIGASGNVTNAGGVLTPKIFLDGFAQQSFRYARNKRAMLVCAPRIRSAINMWGTNFLMVRPGEKKFGVDIQEVETPYGTWAMITDWMLQDYVPTSGTSAAGQGMAGVAFSLDFDEIEMLWLEGAGGSRNIMLQEDVVQNGDDKKVDQIIAEIAFKIKFGSNPSSASGLAGGGRHAKLYNVTDYQS